MQHSFRLPLALAAVLLAGALGVRPAAAQDALPLAPVASSAASALVGTPVASIGALFGSPGLDEIEDRVVSMANDYDGQFRDWGMRFYLLFFVTQFALLGITLVVRGPFAMSTYRPMSGFSPFANFLFLFVAGTLGYFIVAFSFVPPGGGGDYGDWFDGSGGWVHWIFSALSEAGQRTGCKEDAVEIFGLSMVEACDANGLALIGAKLSALMLALSEQTGNSAGSGMSALAGAGGGATAAFGAFTILAVQLTITKMAFVFTAIMAPLFLSTIVFQPASGIATGYLSFIAYLGTKLFVLYVVAGMIGFVFQTLFEGLLTSFLLDYILTLANASGRNAVTAGKLLGFNLSVITTSAFFIALTLYLPTKVATVVSGGFRLDLNALLFRAELPV